MENYISPCVHVPVESIIDLIADIFLWFEGHPAERAHQFCEELRLPLDKSATLISSIYRAPDRLVSVWTVCQTADGSGREVPNDFKLSMFVRLLGEARLAHTQTQAPEADSESSKSLIP